MPRPSRLRIALHTVAALVVVAAAGYTAYWFLTARQLAAGLEAWTATMRGRGYEIAWHQPRVTGFPLRFRIVLAQGRLARGNPAAYSLAVPEATGEATPWNPARWHVVAPRGATATIQGINGTIAVGTVAGDVVIGPNGDRVNLVARRLQGQGATAGEFDIDVILPRHPPASDRDTALQAATELYHVTLPQGVRPLGNTIESLMVDFTVKGGMPPGDWRQALSQWSNAGGIVEIPRAAVEWGALELEASGTLALDGNLQPEAAMSASIVDHDALIEAAVTAHMLNRGSAAVVKLVLDLLAKRGADGRTRLTAPVTIQDQTLYIGKATIGRVPTINWK